MFDLVRQLLHLVYNVQGLIEWGGLLMVCGVVFVETGLFVGFFLPGDSLLVTAGIFAAAKVLKIDTLLAGVIACAILGDQLGYWIGRRAGMAIYRRPDSLFFKRKHLDEAHRFYEQYGGKTVILARFVPIVRTFCPPVAGAANMRYSRYLGYDVVGGACWGGGLVLAGYFLGSLVPNIGREIQWVIAVVVVLSLLPPAIGAWRARQRAAAAALPAAPPPAQRTARAAGADRSQAPELAGPSGPE